MKFYFYLFFIPIIFYSVGCSQKNQSILSPNAPVTLTAWNYYNGLQKNAFDDSVNHFNETLGNELGIIVEAYSQGGVQDLSTNLFNAIEGALGAYETPNISNAYPDLAYSLYQKNLLVPLDKYLSEEEIQEYETAFIQEGQLDNHHLFIMPTAKSTESLFLNKTFFDAFTQAYNMENPNNPIDYHSLSSWESLIETSEKYYQYTDAQTPKIDNDGRAFLAIDNIANYIIVGAKQLGVELIQVTDDVPSFDWNEEALQRLWVTYYDAVEKGLFINQSRFGSDEVKIGNALAVIGSTVSAQYYPQELMENNGDSHKIELLVLPLPSFASGQPVVSTQGAGMVVIKSKPKVEYASTVFLKWFTDVNTNILFSMYSGYIPVKKASLEENNIGQILSDLTLGGISSQNLAKSLSAGIKQIKENTTYSAPIFEGSYNLRTILESSLADFSLAARKDFLIRQEQSGRASAITQSRSHEDFEKWLEILRNESIRYSGIQ